MFSSLSGLSPRGLLASYLSRSLAKFFGIDPALVETSLVRDARVVLRDVDIKPRRLGSRGDSSLRAAGRIGRVEFSWAWDGASLIRDVRLDLGGISVRVDVIDGGSAADGFSEAVGEEGVARSREGASDIEAPPDWRARYMQQIVDHLTLAIADVTVFIHPGGGSQVVLQAKDMELVTMRSESIKEGSPSALMQTICLESVEAWMEQEGGRFPLLEPFGYHASVTRISGRRFLDGVLSGLLVEGGSGGDSPRVSSTVRFHAGNRQIAGMNGLQRLLLLVGEDGSEGAASPDEGPPHDAKESQGKARDAAEMSSIFRLPFRSVQIALENETDLRLESCVLNYCTDGSELSAECSGGVWIGDAPFSRDTRWLLDLASSELVLDSLLSRDAYTTEEQADDEPFHLDLSFDMFQKVYCATQSIVPQHAEVEAVVDQSTQPSPFSWRVRSTRPVAFRFAGEGETWVQISATSPYLGLGSLAPNGTISFECASADFASSAGFTVHVPRVCTGDDGRLVVEHRVSAAVDSPGALQVLQALWNQVSDVVGGDSPGRGLPVDVSLAGIDVTLKEPQLSTAHLSRISGSGNEWLVGSLRVHGVGRVTLDASSLRVALGARKTTVLVQMIERLTYDGIDYLAAPIDGTMLEIEDDGALSIAFKDVHVKCSERATATQGDGNDLKEQSLAIPISFRVTVERLRAELSAAQNINIGGVNFWVRPMDELVTLGMDLESIKAKLNDTMEVSCGKINASMEVCMTRGDATGSELSIPGLGRLSSASVTARNIIHLTSATGRLGKPLDVVQISYRGGTLMIKCKKVIFCPKRGNPKTIGGGLPPFNLPFAVYLEVGRFILMEDFGPGKPGVCCDGLRIHLTSHNTSMGINAHCNYAQGRGVNQVDFSVKGVKLNLRKTAEDGEDEFLGLTEAHVSLKEVSTMSAPSHGLKLKAPICNLVIQFKNNSIDMKCDLIHLSHTQSRDQAIRSEEDETPTEFSSIPVPFSMTVNQVVIDLGQRRVACDQFSTQYTKTSATSAKSLHVGITLLDGDFGSDSYKVKGISITTNWQNVVEHDCDIKVPCLGSLLFAQVELEACTEMTTRSFSLIEPVQRARLMFQEGFLVLELTELQLDVTKAFGSSDYPLSDKSSKKSTLDMIQVPIGFTVSNKLRLKSATFDIQFDNTGIDYVRSPSSPQGTVFIHSDRFLEGNMLAGKKLDLSFHLSLSDLKEEKGSISDMIPGLEYVERASVKVEEVTRFFVEKLGRLSQPLRNASITYQNGAFATDIEAVQFQCSGLDHSLALGLKQLNVRIQPDPFDKTVHLTSKIGTISGHGDISFGASGVNIMASIVPVTANNEVIISKPIVIPSLGYASLIILDVSEVPILSIQNMGHLKSPITKLAVRFENDIISLSCQAVSVQRSIGNKASPTQHSRDNLPCELPCRASLSIETFQLSESLNPTDHREIRCRSLNLTLEPLKVWMGQPKASIQGPGIGIQFIGSDFNSIEGSTIISVPRLSVSGSLQLNDLQMVRNLAIGIERAALSAEFSSSDWSGSLEKEHPVIIRLPFASIPKFNLTLRYVGVLVNINDAIIACDEFQGSANTTLSQLGNHYINVVKGRIPFLLAKADVAGFNVGDSVGVMAGRTLMKSSVIGATAGVVSRDVVGATLTMGKESRGGSASDRYNFGDFSRGIVSSVKHAAKSGAAMRGDDSYQLGDFTSGTARALGNYASENHSRIAGAGGSAMGMAAGAALLGPVGLVAGSMIGGSAAKSSMSAIVGDPKKDPGNLDDSQHSANHSTFPMQQQSHIQAPDLLSPDYTHHVGHGASRQQNSSQASAPSLRQIGQHSHVPEYSAQRIQHQPNTRAAPTAAQQEGYRFGDITRGVVARGKKSDGRDENSGYKLGDFTRGLFG